MLSGTATTAPERASGKMFGSGRQLISAQEARNSNNGLRENHQGLILDA